MPEARSLKNYRQEMYKIWKNGEIIESLQPGVFVLVTTQRVFGRLIHQCGAKKGHLLFVHTWKDAERWGELNGGVRPCKICKPKPNDWYERCLLCGTYLINPMSRRTIKQKCQCGSLYVRATPSGIQYICEKAGDVLLVGPY